MLLKVLNWGHLVVALLGAASANFGGDATVGLIMLSIAPIVTLVKLKDLDTDSED